MLRGVKELDKGSTSCTLNKGLPKRVTDEVRIEVHNNVDVETLRQRGSLRGRGQDRYLPQGTMDCEQLGQCHTPTLFLARNKTKLDSPSVVRPQSSYSGRFTET